MASPVAAQPCLLSFAEARRGFADGTDHPRAYLERVLERLHAWEPSLAAFTALDVAGARRAADASSRRWAEGRPASPVDGMPVGVKDVIGTADLPTEAGLRAYAGHRPPVDSAAVFALRQAGAVVVGKTVTTEFALTHPAATRNPHDLDRTAGGSSSGSAAAVGAGILPVALGTQATGSLLRPASFCGAYAYKPTQGALNRGGNHDIQSSSTLGVIAGGLDDLWRTAWEIFARVGGDPGSPGLFGEPSPTPAAAPQVVARLETQGWPAASESARQALLEVMESLRRAGVTVVDRRQDAVAAVEDVLADALEHCRAIVNVESRWPLMAVEQRVPGSLSATSRARLEAGLEVSPGAYRELLRWRRRAQEAFSMLMHDVDAVVTLSAPGAAPLGLASTGDAALVAPATVLGAPALSLPVLRDGGLPLGLQLMGAPHGDPALFGTAAWLLRLVEPPQGRVA